MSSRRQAQARNTGMSYEEDFEDPDAGTCTCFMAFWLRARPRAETGEIFGLVHYCFLAPLPPLIPVSLLGAWGGESFVADFDVAAGRS